MTISGVCKVEFANYVEAKVSEGLKKKDIIETFAKDADISEDTVKNWMYPEGKKAYEEKRSKKGTKMTKKVSETTLDSKPDLGLVSDSSDNFTIVSSWKKEMEKQLDTASDILNKTIVLGDYDSRFVVRECFGKIDEFLRLYVKKRKNKELPFTNN